VGIFRYWIYHAGPGCIVHLPLTTVGVCVDPVGVRQVYVGGVDVNVHVALLPGPSITMLDGILSQSITKANNCARVEPASNVAVHVPSVGVAVCPPTVEGLHVAVGGVGGVGGVTVVLPSGQVTARQVTGVCS
jgi:hypothetical protein